MVVWIILHFGPHFSVERILYYKTHEIFAILYLLFYMLNGSLISLHTENLSPPPPKLSCSLNLFSVQLKITEGQHFLYDDIKSKLLFGDMQQ